MECAICLGGAFEVTEQDAALEIELVGDLAAILALSADSKKPVTDSRDGLQVTLVAGNTQLS